MASRKRSPKKVSGEQAENLRQRIAQANEQIAANDTADLEAERADLLRQIYGTN